MTLLSLLADAPFLALAFLAAVLRAGLAGVEWGP
jgi:hypothetical protein